MLITIGPDSEGKLLRDYLRKDLGLSRGMLVRLKQDEQGILLNGAHVTVRAVLREGDLLSLTLEDDSDDENEQIAAVELPLDILYEDEDLVVLNKPAGMPTHPSHDHHEDTLANALVWHYRQKGVPFVFRAVNRLDRDTTGVVLVARNRPAAYALSRQLMEGTIRKEYLAAAEGCLIGTGEISAAIRRKEASIILRETCPEGEGDPSRTRYEVLYSGTDFSAVRVFPLTGRTHQIRVHFAHIGHPLIGDYLYGTPGKMGMARHALHACSLTFSQPRTGKIIRAEAPLPADMLPFFEEKHFFEETRKETP